MTRALRAALAAFPPLLVVLLCGFSTETASVSSVPILVTSAPAYDPLAGLRGADRFPKGAQLLIVRDSKAEPLVPDFAASADASVSFDAKTVLFSGKKRETDCWQIWEVTLADHSLRQVTSGGPDAVRPLYLPGRRLVFARRGAQGFQLVATGLDGKDELPLTYMAASAIPADVLADGRILFEAGYPLGSGNTPELFLVYSDGSGVESYRCDHGSSAGPGRWGGRQLASGDVVFTHGASLARFTSPLAHEERIAAPHGDYAGGVVEMPDGAWVVSVRSSVSAPYALREWKPSAAAMTPVLSRAGENLVEPVLLAARERPRQHPSALHDWNYANMLALDARTSREGDLKIAPARVRLETMNAAGKAMAMGTSPVESDGSFFVKAPADQPIRFVLLDDKGATVRQEHGWFWIRRGEQRVCVGCHTGPERAAENNVPAVLIRSTNPTDLTGVITAGAGVPAAAAQAEKGSR
jgi:Hydrazine synthase alpha subunit middle domain